jgi:hypothetical protein
VKLSIHATISPEKVTDYLLVLREESDKSAFFES